MDKSYTESFYNLLHGTDECAAYKIKQNGFELSTREENWCGDGIYFYDIKSKACWAAERKCEEIKKETGKKPRRALVKAVILDLPKNDILDLRNHHDLCDFEDKTREIFDTHNRLSFETVDDEVERRIKLRSLLLAFYAEKQKKKLIVGIFKQRPQPKYGHSIFFADRLDLIFGVETIYCVKDKNILRNIEITS